MKKILLLFLLLVQLFVFTGCSKDLESLTIGDQYIFKMEEENYLIYFYKDGCSSCELTTPIVLQFVKEGDKKVYAVNLHPEGEDQSRIFRKFTLGNTAQGVKGDFYVDGTTAWSEMYIASSPALIEVKTEEYKGEKVKMAYFIANGETAITEYLQGLLNE